MGTGMAIRGVEASSSKTYMGDNGLFPNPSGTLSTSSGVMGLAKLCTVGGCLALFRPASHANVSACHSSRTGIHCQSQSLVKCPVFPVGFGRSTLAGIFHAGGCAAYLAACLGVRRLAQMVRA